MIVGDLPPYEAFPIGGTNSVRGYNEGERVPLQPPGPACCKRPLGCLHLPPKLAVPPARDLLPRERRASRKAAACAGRPCAPQWHPVPAPASVSIHVRSCTAGCPAVRANAPPPPPASGALGTGRNYVTGSAELRVPLVPPVEATLFGDWGSDLDSGATIPGDPAGARGKPGAAGSLAGLVLE